MKRTFIFLVIFFLFVLLLYIPSLNGYFQHDEWSTFAAYISLKGGSFIESFKYFFWPDVSHYTPIAKILFYSEYILFKFDFKWYVLLSLILHSVAAFLVFELSNRIFNDRFISIITSIIFIFSSAAYQSVTWMGASVITESATIFALLSLIFFIDYTKHKRKLFLWILFYFLSVLTKEIAILLPLSFGIYYFLFMNLNIKKDFKSKILPIALPFCFYFVVRFVFFLLPSKLASQYVVTNSQSYIEILYNFVSFSWKSIVQTLIPVREMIDISRFIAGLKGITNETIIETTVSEFVSIGLFGFIIIYFLKFMKVKKTKIKRIFLFGLLLTILNSLVYSFSPGRVGIITFIDSRNLYFPSIGFSLLFTVFFFDLFQRKKMIGVLILALFFYINLFNFNIEFSRLSQTGIERRNILDSILSDIPNLPPKAIFYTESDTSFYGMPDTEKILPFETGPGQILLVMYQNKAIYPSIFFKNKFLQYIGDQGYLESDGRGFGYFRDFNDLKKAYIKYKFPLDSVISFHYDSKLEKLTDISGMVRVRLK